MTNKQAVIETASGNIVIDLRPDLALNQVGDLIKHHLVEGTCGSTSALICD